MAKKKTTEEFIDDAIVEHGVDKYDYSQVEYIGSNEKVCIICPTHGKFYQRANEHLSGKGCSKCANEDRRSSTEEFIAKAENVHGRGKFDYSLTRYKNAKSKVIIICNEHGQFEQVPLAHLAGHGCKECFEATKRYNYSTDLFVAEAIIKHGLLYNYSLVEYVDISTKVSIICDKHGVFKQTPAIHLRGHGCPHCREYNRLSHSSFIEKANNKHNGKYSYVLVDYKSGNEIIKILCPEHGYFDQRAKEHLKGSGCPSCAKTGFDSIKRGYVYILQSPDFLKVGITNKTAAIRAEQINTTSPQKFEVIFSKSMEGNVAINVERGLINWLRQSGHRQPTQKFDGYTECFKQDTIIVPHVIDKLLELEYNEVIG